MRVLLIILAIFVIVFDVSAQKPVKKVTTAKSVKPIPTRTPSEKSRFETAILITQSLKRAAALRSFLEDFPESSHAVDAGERLVAARADGANEMLKSDQPTEAFNLLKTTVNEAPNPISQKIFSEVISKFPMLLFTNGNLAASGEIALLIEKRVDVDAEKLLTLANFFISTENSSDALRLAKRAVEIDPASVAGYQILGLAHRLNFDLENSIAANKKAFELAPESDTIKLSLAQLFRAAGRPADALELVWPMVAANENAAAAQTIKVLSLFDLGNKFEAETTFDRAMKATPGNVALVASAAYWYAANGDGPNAILHAEEAIDLEPRFVWGHIALGRGLMLQKKFTEAEQTLIKARKFGKFPSLEYEIALSRVALGFYREAVEDIRGIFTVTDGRIKTNLGGRIPRTAATFSDLLADERKASIFEPRSSETEFSTQLAALLAFDQTVNAANSDSEAMRTAATKFVAGTDAMQLHRQIYAATTLLEKKVSPEIVLDITQAAINRVEDGISVSQASSAVMAAELYEARRSSFLADQFVIVPLVPKPTLSAIIRGRIEETAGWALFEKQNYAEAEVRFRRAISVLPADSAWWRSSLWRLGMTLEISGKDKEALDAYVTSYRSQPGSGSKYLTIRSVYQKVNGNTTDIETLVGPNPVQIDTVAAVPTVTATPEPTPEVKPIIEPAKIEQQNKVPEQTSEAPAQTNEPKPTPTEVVTPTIKPTPTPVETEEPVLDKPNAADDKNISVSEKKSAESNSNETNPLFEPVIITIPNRLNSKPKPAEETNGSNRPRVIIGALEPAIEPVCTINVSQSEVSLTNSVGNVSILAGTGTERDEKGLSARSSSPDDVEVIPEPKIDGVTGRTLFSIRSKSNKTGVFQVIFQSTCGKKEITVRVR